MVANRDIYCMTEVDSPGIYLNGKNLNMPMPHRELIQRRDVPSCELISYHYVVA